MNRKDIPDWAKTLIETYGPMNWWPIVKGEECLYLPEFLERARTPEEQFEIAIGAILTQNTAWSNVVKALIGLKRDGVFAPEKLAKLSDLPERLKSTGYFRMKAKKVLAFLDFLKGLPGESLDSLSGMEQSEARRILLSVHGVGFETADSILLYALEFPVFIADAYARRFLSRMGRVTEGSGYEAVRIEMEKELPRDLTFHRILHAAIVEHGKRFCSAKPRCEGCPEGFMCDFAEKRTTYAQ